MPSENNNPWIEYDQRKKRCIWMLVGFFPAVLLVGGIAVTWFDTATPMMVCAAIWGVALIVTGRRFATWPCPRCGKEFSTKFGRSQAFFAKECLHCGLPKYGDHAA